MDVKVKHVRNNGQKIEEAIVGKQDSIEELQILLGIIKEKVKDAKELKTYINIPTIREKKPINPLPLESAE